MNLPLYLPLINLMQLPANLSHVCFCSYQGVEDALSIRSLGSHRVGILSCLHQDSKAYMCELSAALLPEQSDSVHIPLPLKKKERKYWQSPFIGK